MWPSTICLLRALFIQTILNQYLVFSPTDTRTEEFIEIPVTIFTQLRFSIHRAPNFLKPTTEADRMTIIKTETNKLREPKRLHQSSTPNPKAGEELSVLRHIFKPLEEACDSCQHPVLAAFHINDMYYADIRIDGLAILDTKKLGSVPTDKLISTFHFVSDSSPEEYHLAAKEFRFGTPIKTRPIHISDPASYIQDHVPDGRRVILIHDGLAMTRWWEAWDYDKSSYCLNTLELTRQIYCPSGKLREVAPYLPYLPLPPAWGNAGNKANATLKHLLSLAMRITRNDTQTKRMELLRQAVLFPADMPKQSPAKAGLLEKGLEKELYEPVSAEQMEVKAKKKAKHPEIT